MCVESKCVLIWKIEREFKARSTCMGNYRGEKFFEDFVATEIGFKPAGPAQCHKTESK